MNAQTKPVVLMISLGVILGASFLIVRRFHAQPKPGQLQWQVQEMVGATAASEITKLVGGHGQIAVVYLDTSRSRIEPLERELAGFQTAIAAQGQVRIVIDKKVPDTTAILSVNEFAMPAEIYLDLLKNHPELDGIVSFVGAPRLTEEQVLQLPSKRPRLVAVFGEGFLGPKLRMLMEKDVLQTAILPNPTPASITDGHLPSPAEAFGLAFVVVAPPTANLLPEE